MVLGLLLSACAEDVGGDDAEGSPTTETETATTEEEPDDAEDASTTTEPEQEPTAITMALSGSTIEFFFGHHVAHYLGYFEEEGLDVEIVETGGSSEAAQLLGAGTVDIGQAVPEAALVAMQFADLYPFYTYATEPFFDWFVLGDSEYQTVADLEGTTIGIAAPEDGAVPATRFFLTEAGIDPETDVEIVVVGEQPATVISAFEQDRIQSFSGTRSLIGPFASAGFEVRSVYPESFSGGLPVEGLLTNEEWAEDTETLEAIGRAVAKGTLFCLNSMEACLNVIGEIRPDAVEDREAAQANLEAYFPVMTPPEGPDGRLFFSPTTVSGWEQFLGIYGSPEIWPEEPPIEDPDSIDLERLVIEDLRDPMNDFDYDAVVAESNEWAER